MKRILALLVSFIVSFSLCGCEHKSDAFKTFSVRVTSDRVNTKLMDEYFINHPDDYPSYTELKENRPDLLNNIRNVTPHELKELCTIYRFTGTHNGFLDCETFLIYHGDVYHIGIGWGGFGVTQFAYIHSTSQHLLYYIFSCGSGIHRSIVNAFDFQTKTIKIPDLDLTDLEMRDIQFSLSNNDLSLDLYISDMYWMDEDYIGVRMIRKELYKKGIQNLSLLDVKSSSMPPA